MGERAFQQMLTSADRGGMSRTEWRKQSLTANAQGKHKLANVSVFFEVQRSPRLGGGNKTKEMYYSLSLKMISFVLFPQASQPSMNFNISELVYYLQR